MCSLGLTELCPPESDKLLFIPQNPAACPTPPRTCPPDSPDGWEAPFQWPLNCCTSHFCFNCLLGRPFAQPARGGFEGRSCASFVLVDFMEKSGSRIVLSFLKTVVSFQWAPCWPPMAGTWSSAASSSTCSSRSCPAGWGPCGRGGWTELRRPWVSAGDPEGGQGLTPLPLAFVSLLWRARSTWS